MVKLLFVPIVAMTLAGCSALQPQIEVKPMVSESYVTTLIDSYVKNDELSKKRTAYSTETNKDKKKQIRDQTTNELMLISDSLYHEFKTELFNNRALMNTTVQVLDLALTGTAAVTGTIHAKSNMAAFSTFLKGANTSFDKNYYAEQTIGSIINVMDGERAVVKTELLTGLQADVDKFGFEAAVRLVSEYHQKGSVLDAIVALSRNTGAIAQGQISDLNSKMQSLGLR